MGEEYIRFEVKDIAQGKRSKLASWGPFDDVSNRHVRTASRGRAEIASSQLLINEISPWAKKVENALEFYTGTACGYDCSLLFFSTIYTFFCVESYGKPGAGVPNVNESRHFAF
ncbi:hypothetical protein WN943_012184 [Citrus x changshan-huyou]